MTKISVSCEWLSGCAGCEMSLVDLHEKLLHVLQQIQIIRCPMLMDEKGYPPAAIGMVTGALRTTHDLECAQRMRDTCETIIAFGTCAVYGGPQGSGYAHSTAQLADKAFVNNPTTATHFVPDQRVAPLLPEGVRPLDSQIKVDFYLPGCGPHPYYVLETLSALLQKRQPEFGPHNVCFNCQRLMKTTEVAQLRRFHAQPLDPTVCFLSQGVVCLGSATLDRCLAPCPQKGQPCSGCAGPSEQIIIEPYRDIRTEIADRMSRLTKIPRQEVVRELERRAKTHYAYAMASPVFRQKPTFLLRRWISN